MEKSTYQIDFDEWEFIPDTKFLDHHHDSPKAKNHPVFDPKTMSPGMNYFIIQSPTSPHIVTTPVPIHLQPNPIKHLDKEHELDINKVAPLPLAEEKKQMNLGLLTAAEADQDTVSSRVFFKKMKENEFVDMKMDSPKASNRGIKFQTEAGSVQFEEKEEQEVIDKEMIEQDMVNKKNSSTKKENIWKGTRVNIWGWKLTGVEALCYVGIAAATTICIFIFGQNRKTNKQIQYQTYSEEKRIKQVVQQEARSNGGTSEAKGSPLSGAHLIFGSY